MSRIGLAAAVAALVGTSLAGCASMAFDSSSSSEQAQALNFESDPPGAEIRTGQLQTCITPCALTVPPQDQAVAVSKNGYVPQTVQVTTGPPPDHHFWQRPPPTLVPNPVHVVLQPVSKPVHHARSHKSASRTHTAKAASPAPNGDVPSPPPLTQGPVAQGPAAQGPAAQGAVAQRAVAQGPAARGPAAEFSAFPPPPPKP
jgi:hypothetical protein